MSTDPTGCDQSYAFFLIEAPSLLQTIEQDLLSLKEDHSLNKIHNLMRMTHTLKAAAASVGLETLKTVAHSLEDVFKALYNQTVVIDSEFLGLLFQVYECLSLPLTAELTNTSLNESEVLNRATAVFTQLQEKLGDNFCQQAQIPTSAELGVDITQSIFATYVRKRLAALAAALVQPETEQVAIILRSLATVFVGLAESLNLPGFGAIAVWAIAALDAHPDQAVSIAQIALGDFQRTSALVLAGDRTRAGEPDAALQQLAGEQKDREAGEAAQTVRIIPLGDVFSRLHQVLKQLVAVYSKPAELHLSGTHVLVDKTIAQKLYDSLLHLVRNAFDHGIESCETRRQLGKPETGQIYIHAYQQERWIVIEVSDDGKGLDFEKILERAIKMDLLSPEQAISTSEEELLPLLFEPGFSTASQVNDLSGRGFGLNVVRSLLQVLHGSIAVQSQPQQGTTFALKIPHTPTSELTYSQGQVPLTPSVFDSIDAAQVNLPIVPEQTLKTNLFFVWQAGATIFVLPYSSIEEYLVPKADSCVQVQKQWFLHWREQMIPLYKLSELLRYNYPLPDATYTKAEDEAVLTLVINQGQRIFAIESAINRLVTKRELALKPFGAAIAPPCYTYGCTVLEDNRLVLVIEAAALLNAVLITGET